jgi:hypothetical protein
MCYYAARSGNFLATFRNSLSDPFSGLEPIGYPETSVENYHHSLHNNPEEGSSRLLRNGSLKSLKVWRKNKACRRPLPERWPHKTSLQSFTSLRQCGSGQLSMCWRIQFSFQTILFWSNLPFLSNSWHFWHGAPARRGPGPSQYPSFTLRHNTRCRTPLDEWSVRRNALYMTTHNTHKRQTSMSPAGFEPVIPASERPQTHV